MGVLPFIPGTGMKCFILGTPKMSPKKRPNEVCSEPWVRQIDETCQTYATSELLFWTAICPVIVKNSFWIFLDSFGSGLKCLVGFLPRYHSPCICNSLELEPVILHGICYMLACSPSILHGISYILACSSSFI